MEDWIGNLLHFPQFILSVSLKKKVCRGIQVPPNSLKTVFSINQSLAHNTWLWQAILGLFLESHFKTPNEQIGKWAKMRRSLKLCWKGYYFVFQCGFSSQKRRDTAAKYLSRHQSQVCCVTVILGTGRLGCGSFPSPKHHFLWPCSFCATQTYPRCVSSPSARIQTRREELVHRGVQKKSHYFHCCRIFVQELKVFKVGFQNSEVIPQRKR